MAGCLVDALRRCLDLLEMSEAARQVALLLVDLFGFDAALTSYTSPIQPAGRYFNERSTPVSILEEMRAVSMRKSFVEPVSVQYGIDLGRPVEEQLLVTTQDLTDLSLF